MVSFGELDRRMDTCTPSSFHSQRRTGTVFVDSQRTVQVNAAQNTQYVPRSHLGSQVEREEQHVQMLLRRHGLTQVRTIARAGFSTVYEVTDGRERYALKIVDNFADLTPVQEADLLTEAHDHGMSVPRVIDTGHAPKRGYILMEYIEGTSLHHAGRQSPREAARIGADIADMLYILHEEVGWVDRDIKPSNIMLGEDGTVYKLDFGAAAPAQREIRNLTFTPGYLPMDLLIESSKGGRVADPRADQWSLGATIYHAVMGEVPFGRVTGRNEQERSAYLRAIGTGEYPLIKDEFPHDPVAQRLSHVVDVLLEPVARGRYTNCRQVAQALRHAYK